MKIPQAIGAWSLWWRQKLRLRLAFWGLFTLALSLTLLTNACSLEAGQTLQPLNIGIVNWVGFDIALYGQPSEIFKQRGLEVEFTRFENNQDASRAVMRGNLDAAFTSFWDVMQTDRGEGQPQILLVTNISAGADGIVSQPEIKSIEDLRGKKVGAKLGTVNHLILLEALKAHQIDPADVEILDYSNDVSAEKIKTGEIDAAVLWQPLLGETANSIDGNVIHTTGDLDSLVIDTLMSSTSNISAKKAELKQFLLAWFDVMQAVDAQPTEVFNTVGEALGQNGEAFASDYAGVKKGDIALNKRMFAEAGRLQSAKTEIVELLELDPRHGRMIRQDVELDGTLIDEAIAGWQT